MLRPQSLDKFIGQSHIKELLYTAIQASKIRRDVLDHILLSGASGVGKTTLAFIIANELDTKVHVLNAAGIESLDDVRRVILSMNRGDVLFIDEIHRLPIKIEEFLYHPMEDSVIEIEEEFDIFTDEQLSIIKKWELVGGAIGDEMIGYIKKNSKKGTRTVLEEIEPITIIGATTRAGGLTKSLRDRFAISLILERYDENELDLITKQKADMLEIEITDSASRNIAKRGRGTARIVVNYVLRCRDTATVQRYPLITDEIVNKTLDMLGVDKIGLTKIDLEYLKVLARDDNPKGVRAISASLNEDIVTIEDVIEPYLVQVGFVERTPRGRVITLDGRAYIG